ncbi:MAG: hypothetical protein CFE31_10915 [Rhizobiales bacterium PAR1]|nr:MAG: hypothetical protein CFE31_10915 [Rhizobiales bacterium PAR1]
MNTNDESENHWPGYVDALTTMTMMLIFVMMILAVAIFSMSENVSRTLVEQVAKSAGIKLPTEGLSIEAYTKQVMTELETRGLNGADGGAPVASRKPVDNGTATGGELAGLKEGPVALATRTPGDEHVIESNAGARTLAPEAGVGVRRTDSLLTLLFKPRATALDEPAQQEMRSFIEASGNLGGEIRFDLKAYASTDTGAMSDSRRVAYYRAMAVRAQLIAMGVASTRIAVQVLDHVGQDQANRVQVFTKPAASAPATPAAIAPRG